MLKGGCFCGQISYEVNGTAFDTTNCHCSICRRTSGAPFVAWFSVARTEFRFVRGQPARFKSSAKGTRCFCSHCGTQLTFEDMNFPDRIDISVCSLNHPETLPPADHTWTQSRLSWIQLADGLPEYAQDRD
jgi:hypothetical protein